MPDWVPQVLAYQVLALGNTPVTVGSLLTALAILMLAYWVSFLIQRGIHRTFKSRGVAREGTTVVVRRLLHYFIMLAGFGIAFGTIGIDVGALFAAGAFFAVAVGMAMQNVTQNFLSGIILLVERTIEPQDILEIEGTVVRVIDVGIRATIVHTLDDEDLIVPNSVLVQNTVKNFTLKDSRYRIRATVGVVYSADMRVVTQTLQRVATDLSWRHAGSEPRILMRGFGDSSVNFEVSVWIEDPWGMMAARSALYEAIWWGLKEAGVTIAFPQLDLHLDDPVMNSLGELAAAAARDKHSSG